MPASDQIHSLLTPENCTVIFIDHQPQMTFEVASIDRQLLFNNVIGLAKAAKILQVPVILTTVETTGSAATCGRTCSSSSPARSRSSGPA
jgi:nicotinamidase-related amidase